MYLHFQPNLYAILKHNYDTGIASRNVYCVPPPSPTIVDISTTKAQLFSRSLPRIVMEDF